MPAFVEKTALERLTRVEVALLGGGGLLVLEHLLVGVANDAQFVDVYLNFVLEIFQTTQYTYAIARFNVLFIQPTSQVTLPTTSLPSTVVKVVQPQNAGHHSRRIINSKKVLIILFNIENNSTSYGNLS